MPYDPGKHEIVIEIQGTHEKIKVILWSPEWISEYLELVRRYESHHEYYSKSLKIRISPHIQGPERQRRIQELHAYRQQMGIKSARGKNALEDLIQEMRAGIEAAEEHLAVLRAAEGRFWEQYRHYEVAVSRLTDDYDWEWENLLKEQQWETGYINRRAQSAERALWGETAIDAFSLFFMFQPSLLEKGIGSLILSGKNVFLKKILKKAIEKGGIRGIYLVTKTAGKKLVSDYTMDHLINLYRVGEVSQPPLQSEDFQAFFESETFNAYVDNLALKVVHGVIPSEGIIGMLEKYFGHDIQDAQLIRWAVKARLVIRNLREGIEKNCRNFNMIWEKLTSLQSEVFKIEQDIRNARNHLQWLLGKHYAQYRFGELTAFKHDPLPRTLPFCFEVIRKWKPYEAEEYTRRIGPEEVLPG